VGGCRWLWVVVNGCRCVLAVIVEDCGLLCVVVWWLWVGGCGWLWIVVGGCIV